MQNLVKEKTLWFMKIWTLGMENFEHFSITYLVGCVCDIKCYVKHFEILLALWWDSLRRFLLFLFNMKIRGSIWTIQMPHWSIS